MKEKMLNKKRNLKPGEIVSLRYDQAFKIMYGNNDHIEILTMLLSKILGIAYSDLEGKITLLPLNVNNKTVGEKKSERDVVVSLKHDNNYRIVLEVNVKNEFYESVINRNLYYSFNAARRLVEGETYDDMDVTFLVNFNTFFINKRKKVFDKYLLRNDEGDILTEKYKVLNINIAECYNLWYHNKYQGKFDANEEDLLLLSAAMMVDNENDFQKILDIVSMKPEIKELMEGVVSDMNKDDDFVGGYYNWKEENDLINQSIINEVKRKTLKDGIQQGIQQGIQENQKEIVLGMHEEGLSIETISKISKLSVDEINEIINSNKKS